MLVRNPNMTILSARDQRKFNSLEKSMMSLDKRISNLQSRNRPSFQRTIDRLQERRNSNLARIQQINPSYTPIQPFDPQPRLQSAMTPAQPRSNQPVQDPVASSQIPFNSVRPMSQTAPNQQFLDQYANYGFSPELQNYLAQQAQMSTMDAGIAYQYNPQTQTFSGMGLGTGPLNLSMQEMMQRAGGAQPSLSPQSQPLPNLPPPMFTYPSPTFQPSFSSQTSTGAQFPQQQYNPFQYSSFFNSLSPQQQTQNTVQVPQLGATYF